MILQTHRTVATFPLLDFLRLRKSPVLTAAFQLEASYHTVHRPQRRIKSLPCAAVRTLQVTSRGNVINNSISTRYSTHTRDQTAATGSTSLPDQTYHEMADLYFEAILEEVEELQNKGSGIIAEYSVRLFRILFSLIHL